MITVFKNNNLHIKLDTDELEDIKKGKLSDIEVIFYNYDFTPVGEEYCISNYDMAIDVAYNGGWNYYRFPYSKIEDLKQGKMIILYPHTQKYYNEYLKQYFEDDGEGVAIWLYW